MASSSRPSRSSFAGLFGTNFPQLPFDRCRAQIAGLGLTSDVEEKFLRTNAQRVFQVQRVDGLTDVRRPAALAQILKRTSELGFKMASEDGAGGLLRTLAASKPAGRFLELGTGTGVATAWLLDGMDAASALTSIDVDAAVQQVARDALGADPRLTLTAEDALGFLERQRGESFDLVFADALRGKYEGLDLALQVVKQGGFYVIDDMLPQPNWPEGHAAKVAALLETLAANDDFEITPMAWASGLVIAVRKSA